MDAQSNLQNFMESLLSEQSSSTNTERQQRLCGGGRTVECLVFHTDQVLPEAATGCSSLPAASSGRKWLVHRGAVSCPTGREVDQDVPKRLLST